MPDEPISAVRAAPRPKRDAPCVRRRLFRFCSAHWICVRLIAWSRNHRKPRKTKEVSTFSDSVA